MAGRSQNRKATILMKEFGSQWTCMTDEKKKPYFKMAEKGKHLLIIKKLWALKIHFCKNLINKNLSTSLSLSFSTRMNSAYIINSPISYESRFFIILLISRLLPA